METLASCIPSCSVSFYAKTSICFYLMWPNMTMSYAKLLQN